MYAFKVETGFARGFEERYEDERDLDWTQFSQDQTILVALHLDATTDPSLGDRMDPDFRFESFKTPEGYRVNADGRMYWMSSDGRDYYQGGYWTSLHVRYEQFPARTVQPQEAYD